MSISEDRQEDRSVVAGPNRGSIPAFFSDIGMNIVRLMCCNILFVIFNIPAMFISYLILAFILPKMNSSLMPDEFTSYMIELGLHGQTNRSSDITGEEAAINVYMLFILFCIMLLVTSLLVCIGPVQTGFAKAYGLFASGGSESSFKVFTNGVKQNLKQSVPAMLAGIAVTFVCLLAVSFYINIGLQAGLAIAVLFMVILCFFSLIQNIVYRIMVTRELPLAKIYKNALFFVLLRFGPSLGMVVLNVIVLAVIPFVLIMNAQIVTVGMYVFLYFFILTAVMHYLNNTFADSLIRRYMPAEDNDD